jgi:hypothetical protein
LQDFLEHASRLFLHKTLGRLGSIIGEALAEEVRKYHIPDFSNWKNHDAFERAFARLEKDLRIVTVRIKTAMRS